MCVENGKSMSLSSAMLFAAKVPASWNTSVSSFTYSGVSCLRSIGAGNKALSFSRTRHIGLSLIFLATISSASNVKNSKVGPSPMPTSSLNYIDSCFRFSRRDMMLTESLITLSRETTSFWRSSFMLRPSLRSSCGSGM